MFTKILPVSYFVGQLVELVLATLVQRAGWVVQAMLAGLADQARMACPAVAQAKFGLVAQAKQDFEVVQAKKGWWVGQAMLALQPADCFDCLVQLHYQEHLLADKEK